MANRRYVHPGQSQVIGRDRRDYKAMNTATAGISVAGFDTAPRQHAADGSAKEALSLVIPKYVEDIYPVVVGDTWLKDTKLVINVIPGMAECDECNELFHVIEHEGYCPNCGSFEKTILSGKDFLIREIHIPEG